MTLRDFCNLFSVRSDSFVFYGAKDEGHLDVGEYCYDPKEHLLWDVTRRDEKLVPEMLDLRVVSMELTTDYDGDTWCLVLQ